MTNFLPITKKRKEAKHKQKMLISDQAQVDIDTNIQCEDIKAEPLKKEDTNIIISVKYE